MCIQLPFCTQIPGLCRPRTLPLASLRDEQAIIQGTGTIETLVFTVYMFFPLSLLLGHDFSYPILGIIFVVFLGALWG